MNASQNKRGKLVALPRRTDLLVAFSDEQLAEM